MGDYVSTMKDAGEQVLDATKRVQGAAISAVANVSDRVGGYLPDVTDYVPFAESIPAPRDIATASFDLAGKWLQAQRDYLVALFDAITPITGKVLPEKKSHRATVTAVSTPTPKRTSTASAPKRRTAKRTTSSVKRSTSSAKRSA